MQKKRKFSLSESMNLYKRALGLLPAGTGSNARILGATCPILTPCTIFIDRAKGARIWDVDGNEYIDYRLGYGPVILGHGYKSVHQATCEAEKEGIVYALGNKLETELASKIKRLVPAAELMRFANSGTEATMAAIRTARGYTKKEKIIKFIGHYHGGHDYLLFSTSPQKNARTNKPIVASWGVPQDIQKYCIVEEWNDFDAIERTVKKNHKQTAAIICEPVMGNAACIPPAKGYLKHLLELCERYDMLLIFDEVKTGFRLDLGGAQKIFKLKPHISCFAKSLGNGYPISLLAGLREIMDVIGPGKVMHGGTYASSPLSLAAALATLRELEQKRVHEYLNSFGKKLIKGIDEILTDHNLPHVIQGYPSMFQFLFTEKQAITNYRELQYCDYKLYSKLHLELLKRGVMLDEDNEEVIFTSYSHTKRELNETLEAFQEACEAIK